MARSRSRTRSKTASPAPEWVVQPGTEVYGSDDRRIGGVTDIEGKELIVHKGGLFAKDYRIPFSLIDSHTDERIDLTVPTSEATRAHHDESVAPADDAAGVERAAAHDDTTSAMGTASAGGSGTVTGTTEVMRVPVVEEQLEASRHAVERGEVRLETSVSEHEESLDVRVTEERVRIERVLVDRPATAADLAVDGRTLDVAIYGEEVDVQKQPRVVEEVVISKDAVQEIREISGTVRREDIEVIDDTRTREEMNDTATRPAPTSDLLPRS